jgi:hypothetical protein
MPLQFLSGVQFRNPLTTNYIAGRSAEPDKNFQTLVTEVRGNIALLPPPAMPAGLPEAADACAVLVSSGSGFDTCAETGFAASCWMSTFPLN